MERWARSIGARVLDLDVSKDNAFASELYQRHGSAYTGERGDVMSHRTRPEEVMEKQV